ncbi:ribbon-helix-helix domain-containing protein [Paraburkholderia bryophila]|uniref:Putative transcriptional regulator n=1 Tax=Paraburkholderia bryophila TaxID=420952 RepID=A0A7Y9WS85_9BURK|nr:ribbon-helix-helix domain-containing protein [Paraburkholderia bryophila]NYH26244.1 putative transcriptional regulator [Paraburkholderia bryophila]
MDNLNPDKVRTTVVLPRELKARVEAHAERTGAALSTVMRIALNAFLDKQKVTEEVG